MKPHLIILALVITAVAGAYSPCMPSASLTYRAMDGTLLNITYPLNKTIRIDGFTIPVAYNQTLLHEAVKTGKVEVVKDLGCCIVRYRNVLLVTASINGTYMDLYYNESTHLLILASQGDQDLLILVKYHIYEGQCTTATTREGTGATYTGITTSNTATTPATSSPGGPRGGRGSSTAVAILLILAGILALFIIIRWPRRS